MAGSFSASGRDGRGSWEERESARRSRARRSVAFALALFLPLAAFVGSRWYLSVVFTQECGGHLKRAADANTVELARSELETAVAYIEREGMIAGYTSVLYRTPDEDVGFWHRNLAASLEELRAVRSDASQLESSNVLMRLRETLLDHGEHGESITIPDGISVFQHNRAFCAFGWLSFFAAAAGAWSLLRRFLASY